MQKLFIRVGSHYYAESPQLDGDLELSSLIEKPDIFSEKNLIHKGKEETVFEKPLKELIPVDYKKEIEDLNKRVEDLTELVLLINKDILKLIPLKVVTDNEEVHSDKKEEAPKKVVKKALIKKVAPKKKK